MASPRGGHQAGRWPTPSAVDPTTPGSFATSGTLAGMQRTCASLAVGYERQSAVGLLPKESNRRRKRRRYAAVRIGQLRYAPKYAPRRCPLPQNLPAPGEHCGIADRSQQRGMAKRHQVRRRQRGNLGPSRFDAIAMPISCRAGADPPPPAVSARRSLSPLQKIT